MPSRSPPNRVASSQRSRGHTTSNTIVVPAGRPASTPLPDGAYGPETTLCRDSRSTPGSPGFAMRPTGTSAPGRSAGTTSQRVPTKRDIARTSISSTTTSDGTPSRCRAW